MTMENVRQSCDENVNNKPERHFDIVISEDAMKVIGSVRYIKGIDESSEEEDNEKYPPKYTSDEILEVLKNKGVTFGYDIKEINEMCNDDEQKDYVIAKGIEKIPAVDEKLEIKFQKEVKKQRSDEEFKVDYREVKSISIVKPGDVLCEIIPGKDGVDGKNVKGKILKSEKLKKAKFSMNPGVGIENNKIVALSEGMPDFNNNIFSIVKVYKINGDINLSTGNISFPGDVIVDGSVRVGMKLESGSKSEIKGNVESAQVFTKGDLKVSGNVIDSVVSVGGEDVSKKDLIDVFNNLYKTIEDIIISVHKLKEVSIKSREIPDGQIIKILIEKKLKQVNSQSMYIIKENLNQGGKFDNIVNTLRSKILGFGPLSIKSVSELDQFKDEIKNIIDELKDSIRLSTNISIMYSQNSKISGSGDILIEGEGAYTSEINAGNSVICTGGNTVLRGGNIKAGKKISCIKVGSIGKVRTTLEVTGVGDIFAEAAYGNTRLIINGKSYILQEDSKKVHAYIGKDGLIVVDKFNM